jgi:hypothetical protein
MRDRDVGWVSTPSVKPTAVLSPFTVARPSPLAVGPRGVVGFGRAFRSCA